MKIGRASTAGESPQLLALPRDDPKCATSCPICRHMVRATSVVFEPRSKPTTCPLLVEGTLEYPGAGDPLEYQVLMEVRDDAGKLLSRQVIGIGALHPAEKRIFSLRVEMTPATSSN